MNTPAAVHPHAFASREAMVRAAEACSVALARAMCPRRQALS